MALGLDGHELLQAWHDVEPHVVPAEEQDDDLLVVHVLGVPSADERKCLSQIMPKMEANADTIIHEAVWCRKSSHTPVSEI